MSLVLIIDYRHRVRYLCPRNYVPGKCSHYYVISYRQEIEETLNLPLYGSHEIQGIEDWHQKKPIV